MITATDPRIAAARDGFAQPGDAAAPHPPAAHWRDRARVQVWRAGICLATADTIDADVAAAVRAAAAIAAARCPAVQRGAADLFLSVETVDAIEAIQPDGLSGLLSAIEAGHHGVILRDNDSDSDRAAGGWPADALDDNAGFAKWIKGLVKTVRPPGARLPASVQVERFTAAQIVIPLAPPADDEPPPAPLSAGLRVVAQEDVSKERLVEAATRAGLWLIRHQGKNGLFAYQFQPQTQAWAANDSVVRQAGCAWALSALARAAAAQTQRSNAQSSAIFLQPAYVAIAGVTKYHVKRDGPGRLFYTVGHDGVPRLGAIPLLLLAAGELRGYEPLADKTIDRLVATLLALQQPDGSFGTTVRGLEIEGSEIYYAGQITLALARHYGVKKTGKIAASVSSALRYYRDWWDGGNEHLSFSTWMIQACDVWNTVAPDEADRDHAADYAYAMADWALQFQHQPGHANPLWVGAFENTPGIGTAAYTEGIVHALAIAKRRDDTERIERYRRAVLIAARFLLQLSVEPEDLAFIGGEEHRGAVRSSLRRRNLRCDNAQHFLMASMTVATLLADDDWSL